jgi:NADH-quinone oxidoreductase subunit N
MQKNLSIGLTNVILLQNFTVFPEYFVSISIIYVLIVIVLITYNVFGLMLQKTLSECIALILLMTCYLILNDDLLTLNFISFHNSIINDYLSYITKILICIFSSFYFILISSSLKEQKLTSFEYLLTILFSILGMLLMCSSNDFLTAYLSIELSGLALYILASFKKTSSYSIESGLKYFIIGCVSSAFFLLGTSFIYLFSGSIHFDDFQTLYECDMFFFDEEFVRATCNTTIFLDLLHNPIFNFSWITYYFNIELTNVGRLTISDLLRGMFDFSFIEIGLAFIIFSLCIKLAAAPFHLWSLDVYEGAPTSSSFFFAAITKLSIFVLLIRICFFNFHSAFVHWQFYFFWIGAFSVFVGSFGGLKQRRLKTLLAYSSITNMGYALLALGTATVIGIQMLFFHLIIYMISGLCTWSILMFIRLKHKNKLNNKYSKDLSDLALLRKSNPALALAFSLTMFSIAGIPPMVGFLAKMGIFLSVINIYFYIFALTSAVFSVIATFYYIRVIKVLYFENLLVGKLYYPIKSSNTVILSFLIFLLLILFINPSILYIWAHKLIPISKFAVL